jgi:hypothetical protein
VISIDFKIGGRVTSNHEMKFFLENGSSIGILEKIPVENGNYKYEPFRGIGHYQMATQIDAGGTVKCRLYNEGKVIRFIVKDISESGVLQIQIEP